MWNFVGHQSRKKQHVIKSMYRSLKLLPVSDTCCLHSHFSSPKQVTRLYLIKWVGRAILPWILKKRKLKCLWTTLMTSQAVQTFEVNERRWSIKHLRLFQLRWAARSQTLSLTSAPLRKWTRYWPWSSYAKPVSLQVMKLNALHVVEKSCTTFILSEIKNGLLFMLPYCQSLVNLDIYCWVVINQEEYLSCKTSRILMYKVNTHLLCQSLNDTWLHKITWRPWPAEK